jgi:hypothetical protein
VADHDIRFKDGEDRGVSGSLVEIFSRKTRIGGIGAAPAQRRIAATLAECQALAAAFGLPDIAGLTGEFTLVAAKARAGIIEAELILTATVTQICVVSLEPFDTVVTEHAKLRFLPAASLGEDAEIAELNRESLEGPDEIPYMGDVIDLGAALAEQLALTLDPYPRKPGAQLPPEAMDPAANPFAGLAARTKPANDQD